jgi:hypothetical protein
MRRKIQMNRKASPGRAMLWPLFTQDFALQVSRWAPLMFDILDA